MGASRTVMGWVAALAFAAMSVLPASARVVRGWTLVDLGTLGGPGSYGAAVSNSGLVVGCSDVDAGVAHAFLYRNGVMHDLGAASDSTPGNSCALAVNNDGVAAGRSATGELVTWRDSTITHLGVHGNIGGINDAGVVVGAYGQGASTHAFMYANGNITPLGSDASTATGINAVGEIVGTSNGRAFVYKDGALLDLGTLGGNRSEAKGVNDHGAVCGPVHGRPQPAALVPVRPCDASAVRAELFGRRRHQQPWENRWKRRGHPRLPHRRGNTRASRHLAAGRLERLASPRAHGHQRSRLDRRDRHRSRWKPAGVSAHPRHAGDQHEVDRSSPRLATAVLAARVEWNSSAEIDPPVSSILCPEIQ